MLCPSPGHHYGEAGLYVCTDGHLQYFDAEGIAGHEAHMTELMADVAARKQLDAAGTVAAHSANRRRIRRRGSVSGFGDAAAAAAAAGGAAAAVSHEGAAATMLRRKMQIGKAKNKLLQGLASREHVKGPPRGGAGPDLGGGKT